MKLVLLIVAAAATVALATAKPTSDERNISTNTPLSGNSAVVGQFPWQLTIFSEAGDICSGVFLENITGLGFILTAARCLHAQRYIIYAGGVTIFDTEDGRVSVEITHGRFYIHPDYNPQTGEYDIGIMILNRSIEPNDRIQRIRLPAAGEFIVPAVPVRISGWGLIDGASVNNVLQWSDLNTISNEACATIYGSNVTESTLCAIATGTACVGDFGGPLIHIDNLGVATLHGISSFVHASGCTSGLPLGYVRVEFLVDWLREYYGIT